MWPPLRSLEPTHFCSLDCPMAKAGGWHEGGTCPLQSYRRCCPSLAAGGGTSGMGHTPEMRPACWVQFPGTELCTLHRRQTGVRGFSPLQELGSLHLETQKGDFSWNWWKQTGACSKAKHPSLNSNPASSHVLRWPRASENFSSDVQGTAELLPTATGWSSGQLWKAWSKAHQKV